MTTMELVEVSVRDVARSVLELESGALAMTAAALDETFDLAVAQLSAVFGKIICSGVGKSGHVAAKTAATLSSTGMPAVFVHPTDAAHGDLGIVAPEDGLLLFSKSGVSVDSRSGYPSELMVLTDYGRRFSLPSVLVTENTTDGLSQFVNVTLAMPPLVEAWEPAPTTSTTIQMALGDALAVALLTQQDFQREDFLRLHPGGSIGASQKVL